MGFFRFFSKPEKQPLLNCRRQESGNVFLMLFGAVGMVGLLGAASMTVMKGPVRTMSQVTKRTIAENSMIAAGKLSLISAAQSPTADCDGDGTVEPIQFTVGGTIAGGGLIPSTVGVSKQDPWGTEYGYCTWDHGTDNDSSCGGFTNFRNGVAGIPDEYVIAIVSAGPDRVFNTTCNDYTGPNTTLIKTPGSDDLVLGYTYNEAGTIAGGLWIDDGAGGAEIARTITVEDDSGNDQFMFNPISSAPVLTIGDGLGGPGTGQFPSINVDFLSSYNNAAIDITSDVTSIGDITTTGNVSGADLAASGSITLTGTDNIILGANFLSGDGGDEGISVDATGNVTASNDLTVTNNFSANALSSTTTTSVGTDLSVGGNSTLTGTLGVTGNTTLGVLSAGASTLDSLSVTNSASVGTTLDVGSSVKIGNDVTCAVGGADNGKIRYDGADAQLCENGVWSSLTAINSLDDIGDVNITGIANDQVIAWNGTEWVNVNPNSVVTFPSETDPQVGDVTSTGPNNWCLSDGTKIECTGTLPGETDPQVNTLTSNQWCSANAAGTAIDCTNAPPGGAGTSAGYLTDADADTLVQVEEGPDDDTIRFDTAGTERMVILPTGEIGINDATPVASLHILDTDLLVDAGDYSPATSLLIENSDATIELASDDVGASGSSIDFSEMSGGAMVDKWSIMRRTSIAASNPNGIEFRYGTNIDGTANNRLMFLTNTGKLGVGAAPDPSAIVEFSSTDTGFLAPRVSDPTSAIAAPANGLMAYNTVTNKYQFYDGGSAIWRDIGEGAIPTIPADSIDWDDIIDAMTLDATTTIDMDTNVADLNFDSDTFVIDSSANAIGLGTNTPDASAVLDITSTTRGFLGPRMTTAQRDLIAAPATGLTIYNTTTNTTDYFDGIIWKSFATSSATANQLADADGNTLVQVEEGANDDTIRFDTNGVERAVIEPDGDIAFDTDTLFVDATGDSVGIGTSTPSATALLDLTSTTHGLLPPRMTTVDRDAIVTPATALTIFNTTDGKYQYYDGAVWQDVGSTAAIPADSIDWDDITDTMTLDATTTIDMDTNVADLNFDANTFVIDSANNRIGIGTNTPASSLHIGDTSYTFAGGALSFGDGDTGIYESADDNLRFYFSGSNRWLMTATGISTTTGTGPAIATSTPNFRPRNGDNDTGLGRNSAAAGIGDDDYLVLYTNGIERLSVGSTGSTIISDNALAATAIYADVSSVLELNSTSRGFLAPRVSDPSVAIAAPATGLMAYNTVTNTYQFYNGATWQDIGTGAVPTIPADSIDWDDITDTMTLDATTTIDMDTNVADLNFDSDTFVIDSSANSIGLGTNTPDVSAVLDITSTTRGFLGPRMTTAQRDLIAAPATGLTIYNTTTNTTDYFDGTIWKSFATSSATANQLADADGNTLVQVEEGANDDTIRFDTNGVERAVIAPTGEIGIGTASPLRTVHIQQSDIGLLTTDLNPVTPLLVEATDAYLELVSSESGQTGSMVEWSEVEAAGNLVDKWSLFRNTTNGTGDSDLRLSFGTTNAMITNTELFRFTNEGQFGIGTGGAPNADAVLQIDATDRGFLAPRVSDPSVAIGATVTGLMAYNTVSNTYQFYNGATWQDIGTGAVPTIPADSIDWDDFTDTMTLDATTTIDMDTNVADLNFDSDTFVIDSSANSIGLGTNAPDASAVLDITSTTRGFLGPRMTTAQRDLIAAPATGLTIYNTTTNTTDYFDGTIWKSFATSSNTAKLLSDADGNTLVQVEEGANDDTIRFDTNGTEVMTIDPLGAVNMTADLTIGTTLDVTGITTLVDDLVVDTNTLFVDASGNNVGIGTAAPDASSLLDLTSANTGFLAPRVSDPSVAIAAPATGLMAYNTVTNTYQFYNGATWQDIGTGAVPTIPADSIDWDDITDTMTLDATTTIDMDTNVANLNFDANTFVIDSANNRIGIGTNTPASSLHIGDTSYTFAGGALSFGDGDTGIYESSDDNLNVYLGGVSRWFLGSSSIWTLSGSRTRVTSSGSVLFSTQADTDTGFGLSVGGPADHLALWSGGVEAMTINNVQNVGIGTAAAIDASAQLQVDATSRGFLAPRVSDPTSAIAAPATGLMAYNTVTDLYQFYDGTAWRDFGYGAAVVIPADSIDWDDITDTMTLDATTTIDMDTNAANLNFDNDTFFIDSVNNRIGIKTAAPVSELHLHSTGYSSLSVTNNNSGSAASDGMEMGLGNTVFNFQLKENLPMAFWTNNVQRLYIEADGDIGIGTTTPDASALLELASTSKGFLAPRVSDPTSTIAAPATGLMAYNTVTNLYEFYDGTAWRTVGYGSTPALAIDDLTDAEVDTVNSNVFINHEGGTYGANNANNLALGLRALDSLNNAAGVNLGDNNTAIGIDALTANTTGNENTATGTRVMQSTTTGHMNTAYGYETFMDNTTGQQNTAIGRRALNGSQTGSGNTALGQSAGRGSAGLSDVNDNVFIGKIAGSSVRTGADNNTIIGTGAATSLTTGASNIIIGQGADVSAATVSNELNIGGTVFGDLSTSRVGIGVADVTAIDTDAILELDATDKGFLAPRVSDPASAIVTPATGMMAYDTVTSRYQYYDGATWQDFGFGVGGDNLGNHTATQNLTMSTFTINRTGVGTDGIFFDGGNNAYARKDFAGLSVFTVINETAVTVAGHGSGISFGGNGSAQLGVVGFALENGVNNDDTYFTLSTRLSDTPSEKLRVDSSGALGIATGGAIDASAIVQIDSTDRGFLAPRVSDPTSAIAAPATGLMAYDTVTNRYQYYDGATWQDFGFGVGGDNLGNHTATTDLDMGNNNIVNPTMISFNGTTGAAAPTK